MQLAQGFKMHVGRRVGREHQRQIQHAALQVAAHLRGIVGFDIQRRIGQLPQHGVNPARRIARRKVMLQPQPDRHGGAAGTARGGTGLGQGMAQPARMGLVAPPLGRQFAPGP